MKQKFHPTYALCTLFDHNYLDKGLVLYDSLVKNASDFTLYVLAMSDKCHEVLTDLKLEHLVPIRLADFEDEELLKVKPTRKVGEYCWTCSSSLIRYVLQTYKPDYCTYVDADMYFYSDPSVVIDEMQKRNASVQIIGHRFCKEVEKRADIVGKYCVEFDTFKNDEKGLELVNIWRNQCIEHCSIDGDGIYWGDQKYQDNWCQDYDYCIESENLGLGVAPWNLADYKLEKCVDDSIFLNCKGHSNKLVFYHFENIRYITESYANINAFWARGVQDKLVNNLYIPYMRTIREKKKFLKEKYGLDVLIKSHPGVEGDKEIVIEKRSLIHRILVFLWLHKNPLYWKRYILHDLPYERLSKKNFIKF